MTTSLDADTNVDILELFPANEQDRLEDLVTQGLRLQQLKRVAVDLQNTSALLAMSNSNCVFLRPKRKMR